LNQQFITWSTKADCGSYFVTTYKRGKLTWSKKKKREKRNKGKKKTNCISRIKEKRERKRIRLF